MKRRITGILLSVMMVISVMFSGLPEVDAAKTVSSTSKEIVSSQLTTTCNWSLTISGTEVTAVINDSEAENGRNTAFFIINKKDTDNSISKWDTIEAGKSEITLDTDTFADGEYYAKVSEARKGETSVWQIALYEIHITNGTPVFFFAGGSSEKTFYDGLSSYNYEHYNSLPTYAYKMSNLDEVTTLAKNLTKDCTDDEEKVKAIHDWLATNIQYDYEKYLGGDITPAADPEIVYRDRKGVCSGYSRLARVMFGAVGIPCLNINGYAKAGVEKDTDYTDTNHEWNVVSIDGKWRIVDITWDSYNKYYGEGDENNVKDMAPKYTYYGIDPMLFGSDHVSLNDYSFVDAKGIDLYYNSRTSFNVGDEFKFYGVVRCSLEDGKSDYIEQKYVTFTGYDMSKAGKQTVTVAYGPYKTTYTITVTAPTTEKKIEVSPESTTEDNTVYSTQGKTTSATTTAAKKIVKKKNPITVKVKKKTFKRKSLKKAKKFSIGTKNAKGKVTYTLSKKAKKAKIKVTKKGKVTIPKKCKKGTYTITVKATGNSNFKSKKITVKIIVK